MKIRFYRNDLIDIVNIVSKAISSKSVLPILSALKIIATTDGTVTFEATCIAMSIKHTAPAQVKQGGEIAVEARIFSEIIKRFSDNEIDFESDAEYVIQLKSGKSKFKIQGLSADEFPQTAEIENKYNFMMSPLLLQSIIRRSVPFAAESEGKKPVLQGVLFDIKNNELYVVASDGLRLSYIPTHLHIDNDDKQFIIPAQVLKNMPKFEGNNNITVISDGRCMLFKYGNYSVKISLLEGIYLSYEKILQQDTKIIIRVSKNDMINSIERVGLIANSDSLLDGKKFSRPPAIINISGGKVEISCETNKGTVKDIINAEIDGDDLKIGFNCSFFKDALQSYSSDMVTMEMSTPTSACIMKDIDGSVHLILPVRFR